MGTGPSQLRFLVVVSGVTVGRGWGMARNVADAVQVVMGGVGVGELGLLGVFRRWCGVPAVTVASSSRGIRR